jgi:invasion protein IalB
MHIRPSLALAAIAALLAAPAWSATRHHAPAKAAASGPKALGEFDDWTAATYKQDGQLICYAFTRAHQVSEASGPAPLLTVTERPSSRDEVAITNTTSYPKDASVLLQVNQTGVEMYTSGRDAFARDPKAAVAAFQRGSQAVARSTDAHGEHTTDTYSLRGFSKAYDAITKACPAH